jgi:hypothetical protein
MLFVASVKPSLENQERRAREAERVPIPFQQAAVAAARLTRGGPMVEFNCLVS